MRSSISVHIAVAMLWLLGATAPTGAAEKPKTAPSAAPAPAEAAPAKAGEVTADEVKARLKAVEADAKLKDELKAKLVELYKTAIEQFELAAKNLERAAQFEAQVKSEPEQLKAATDELAKPMAEPTVQAPPEAKLADLERELAKAEAAFKEEQTKATALDTDVAGRTAARAKLPELLAQAKQDLEKVAEKLKIQAPEDEPAELTQARLAALQARQQAISADVKAREAELASHDATGKLMRARRDLAVRKAAALGKIKDAWTKIVADQRLKEAKQQAAAAQREKERLADIPELKTLAEANAKLAKRREKLSPLIEKAKADLKQVLEDRKTYRDEFANIKKKAEAVGLTNAVGLVLRKKRASLPNIRQYRQKIGDLEKNLAKAQLESLDLNEKRGELADLEARLKAVMDQEGIRGKALAERKWIESHVRNLLADKYKYLTALVDDCEKYDTTLGELYFEQKQLIGLVAAYAAYIDERVLWIRSVDPIGRADLAKGWEAFCWLADPADWQDLLGALWDELTGQWPLTAAGLIVLALWVIFYRRLAVRLREIGQRVHDVRADSFGLTLQAVAISLIMAGGPPLLLAFVGWRLNMSAEASLFAKIMADALYATAAFFLAIEVLRKLCRPKGVADEHFRWRLEALRPIRRNLLGVLAASLPVVFVVTATELSGDADRQGSLGRAAFAAGMVIIALFATRVVRPSGVVMGPVLARAPGGWLDRLRYVWYPLATVGPLFLGALSLIGYHYTALQFARRLQSTSLLVLALVFVHQMVLRWLFVARRQLATRMALERLRTAQVSEGPSDQVDTESGAVVLGEPEVNIGAISEQTQRLLRGVLLVAALIGVWLIWVDVLPALRILRRVHLWATTAADGTQAWITLENIAVAAIVVGLTAAAARNIPGLLQIAVLQRLPLEPGARYAFETLSKYMIAIVGIIVAFARIGLGWSQVQWLVAAMTVGLGFGLQEIFANFVSGVIILFERPIRVGDVVTVGDVSGRVSRIRIRATTITDWNRKELIVPNKEFITGQLINWSLSDSIVRVVIPVGVAYGSNTDLAHEQLLQVAADCPNVLDDPAPQALFLGFGDNTLNFEMRVFIPSMDVWAGTLHDLHMAIDKAFRKNKIEIAFPQRDIHIRSMDITWPAPPMPPTPDGKPGQ